VASEKILNRFWGPKVSWVKELGHLGVNRGRRLLRSLIGVLALVGLVVVGASAADAGQNSALAAQIVSDPIPGGIAFSATSDNSQANSVLQAEKGVSQQYGYRVAVAVAGWHLPSTVKKFTMVVLIGFTLPNSSPSASEIAAFARSGSSSASSTFCVGVTGEPAVSNTPGPSLPNSHQVRCSPISGKTVVAVVFAKGSVLAIVDSDVADRAQLLTVAKAQYHELTSTDVSIPGASNNDWVWVLIALGGLLVLLAVVFAAVRAKRKIARLESELAAALTIEHPAQAAGDEGEVDSDVHFGVASDAGAEEPQD
jgi:hypothetical protein